MSFSYHGCIRQDYSNNTEMEAEPGQHFTTEWNSLKHHLTVLKFFTTFPILLEVL